MPDIKMNFKRLKESEMTFKDIFDIIYKNEDTTACEFEMDGSIVKWSYSDYRVKVSKAASKILKVVGQTEPGSFVILKMPNSPLWVVMFWAILTAGFNPVLVDASLNEEMTDYLARQSGAKWIFDSPVDFENEDEIASSNWGKEIALCTSGTTSTSRIFTYTDEAISYQILNLEVFIQNKYICPKAGDKTLAFLPFHHVFGFIAQYLLYSFVGATMVYIKDRAPETLMNACRQHGVTHILTVPLLVNNLTTGIMRKVRQASPVQQLLFKFMIGTSVTLQKLNLDLGLKLAKRMFGKFLNNLLGTQIKMFICGGSHLPYEANKIINGIGYYTTCGYGMTEIGIASAQLDYSLGKRLTGTVGRKLDYFEYRLVGENSGSQGELLVRGRTIHTGLLVNGLRANPELDSDGWFSTGDITNINEGILWIKGRVKDVIINESGENVYPDEIEEYFSELPHANNISVLGVSRDSSYENITLVLSMNKPDMTQENLAGLVETIGRINGTLPVLKKINKVYATSSQLPLASGIKVKRNKLRELIEKRQIEFMELDLKNKTVEIREAVKVESRYSEDIEHELGLIKNEIRKCFSEVLNIPEKDIKDDSHFIDDLGGDSLSSIGLRIKIEELFNIIIPDVDYFECNNVRDIAILILKKTKGLGAFGEAATTNSHPLEDVHIITSFEDSREFKSFLPRQQQLSGVENPYFICHDSVLSDVSMLNGETEVLNFGSYNYIGMSGHPETVKAAKEAVEKYGTSASGSRLLAGEKHLYQELEREIALWKHTQDALVLVGGHSTNVTFVGNFCNEKDLILYDALAHNSIVQGCQLSRSDAKAFPHNDFKTLETILRNARNRYEKILVVIEGAYSMDGDIAPVPEFVKLKKKYGFFLMVDEAHSACVIGENGGGVDEYFDLNPFDIDIKMGTLSKGLGTCGGYLAGKRSLIEYLRYNVPGFVFSVGISPPLAAATLQAIRILQRDNSAVKRLHKNIETFVTEAHKRNLNTCLAGETAIIPILIGKDEDAFMFSQLLLQKGVSVPPAVYPAVPRDQARLRFCVTSEHKEEQIIRALDILLEVSKECGINI